MSAVEHSTYQLSEIVLKLRDDLNVSLRAEAGAPVWMLEDERTGRFYRVGQREYTFLSLLDGRRTLGAAIGRAATVLNELALSVEEAAGLARWLLESGLATTSQSTTALRVLQTESRTRRQRFWQRLMNPLSCTVPLCRPDRWMQMLAALGGWLFSGPMLAAGLAVIGYALLVVMQSWDQFRGQAPSVVARDNWVWLAASWLGLKLLHETAHGVACRRFGGPVREAGITLVLFVPLPYVDVTSAWRFGSRWRRMLVSAAGMWVELLIGAAAAILWSYSEPGLLQQRAQSVAISATLVTLLFNANPLMRFDGYFILSDLLGLPNLAQRGQHAWRALGRRWFLGLPGELPAGTRCQTVLVLAYGLAAMLWRVTVCVGLILAADALFLGAGVILAALATIAWVVWPVGRLLWFVMRGTAIELPSRPRFAVSLSIIASLLWIGGRSLHWRRGLEAPAVVAYYPLSEVRPAAAGFITQVDVMDGATVEAGQVLLRLRNVELEAEIVDITQQLQQSEVRSRQALQAENLPRWEAEQERLQALRVRLELLESRLQGLVVRAPRAGKLLTPNVGSLAGRYVQVGEAILMLGDPHDKHVLALIEPSDQPQFAAAIGQRLPLRVTGRGASIREVELRAMTSRADFALPHPALGAHADGPLEVRTKAVRTEAADANQFELIEPRLLLELSLTSDDESRLAVGETGVVHLAADRQALGDLLSDSLSKWWTDREAALRDRWYQ